MAAKYWLSGAAIVGFAGLALAIHYEPSGRAAPDIQDSAAIRAAIEAAVAAADFGDAQAPMSRSRST